MLSTILICAGVALLAALIALIIWLPDRVEYVETIVIEAPRSRVYDAIRYQEQLMEWSAWPKETNSLCEVAREDGQVGAQTIYQNKKGKAFGYQEVTALVPNERIEFFLKSHVAPFEDHVEMTFLLWPRGDQETKVMLWFRESLKKPLFLIAYVGGILRWVRGMHRKDLVGLKQYVESR